MNQRSKQVAQIWYTCNEVSSPLSNKYYSKLGTAAGLVNKYNKSTCKGPYHYFYKVFALVEIDVVGEKPNE